MPRRKLPKNQAAPPPPPPHAQVSSSDGSAHAPDPAFIDSTAYIPAVVADGPSAEAAAEAIEAVPPELVAAALGPTFQASFHFMASIRGPHWELQEFEKTALVHGWTPIVQYLLAKLGSQEQIMVTMAVGTTIAIVGGKLAADLTRPASSRGNTRTRTSEASSVSSGRETAARPPEQSSSFEEPDE